MLKQFCILKWGKKGEKKEKENTHFQFRDFPWL